MLKRRGFGWTAQALRESSAIPFTSSMAVKLVENGKKVFQKIFARQRVKLPESKVPQGPQHNPVLAAKKTDINGLKNGSLFNQFVYRSYIKSLASELRRRAALQFQRNGQNLPIFAFVGLAMTQNNNDCKVSSSIRDIFSEDSSVTSSILGKVQHLSLDAFEFGGIIGKGCNSVVYEARLNSNVVPDLPSVDDIDDTESDIDSDITILSASEEGEITVDFDVINGSVIDEEVTSVSGDEVMEEDFVTVAEEELDNFENKSDENGITSEGPMPTNDFDLGIKMMFNYDVESRADSIYRAMQKESVPARIPVLQDDIDDWQNGNRVRLKKLSPHPNIVDMLGVFVAPVPILDDAQEVYPAALPKRINEDGFGRNMTMFVVMKKYSTTLRQYLTDSRPDMYTRCLMLGQLLEGILHLQNHDIAHRDLKSDNILINDTGHHQVELVICDFGCCLSEQNLGLQVPYVTADTDKGGNSALMAPEIASAVPGTNVILDYSKSDLWAVGTLMYELFGMTNPFYRSTGSEHRLDSRTYQEADLPSLPEDVPEPIKRLAYWILKRDPKERPSALEAATILQLYLSFPDWLAPGRRPCFSVMAESLLVFGAEAVLKGWHNKTKAMTTEDILKLTYLRRINLDEAYRSLKNYHTATRF